MSRNGTRQQVHWRGGPHGGHVVGLYEVYHVAYGVEALLYGVVYLMMHGADVVGHELGLGKVGCALESHGERVQARPPCLAAAAVLYAPLGVFLGNGRYHR